MANVTYKIAGKYDNKAVKDAQSGLQKLGKSITNVNNLFKGFVALKAIGIIKRQVSEALNAYAVQQKAISGLTVAIDNNAKLTSKSLQNLIKYTSELQTKSIYGDEMLQGQATFLASMGLTEDKIKDVLKASVELTSSGYGSLETNVKNLSATLTGQIGLLGKVIPEFKDLTKEQLANGAGLDIVSKKYKGFAENLALDTLDGKMKQMNNTMGDFKEALGAAFAPIASPFFTFVNTIIGKWTTAINEMLRYRKLSKKGEERSVQEDLELTEMQLNKKADEFNAYMRGALGSIGSTFQNYIQNLQMSGQSIDTTDKNVMAFYRSQYQDITDNFTANDPGYRQLTEEMQKLRKHEEELKKQLIALQKEEEVLAGTVSNNTVSTESNTESTNEQTDAFPFEIKFPQVGYDMSAPGFNQGATAEWNNAPQYSGNKILNGAGNSEASTQDLGLGMGGMMETLSSIMSGLGGFVSGLIGAIGSLTSLQMVLDPLGTILDGIMMVLTPIIDSLLKPLIGILTILGQTIGLMIAPALRMLEPVIELISIAFIWLYNYAIRPLGNAIIWLITSINNGIAFVVNGMISAINRIPFVNIGWRMGTMDYDSMKLEAIDQDSLTQAGGQAMGSAQSAGASYSGVRDVVVNIYYNHSYVNGDAREIALNLKGEIELAGALGY